MVAAAAAAAKEEKEEKEEEEQREEEEASAWAMATRRAKCLRCRRTARARLLTHSHLLHILRGRSTARLFRFTVSR